MVGPSDFYSAPAGATALLQNTQCAASGCAGGARFHTIRAEVVVNDPTKPTAQITGGGLSTARWLSGNQALNFVARDNTGVRAASIQLGSRQPVALPISCDVHDLPPASTGRVPSPTSPAGSPTAPTRSASRLRTAATTPTSSPAPSRPTTTPPVGSPQSSSAARAGDAPTASPSAGRTHRRRTLRSHAFTTSSARRVVPAAPTGRRPAPTFMSSATCPSTPSATTPSSCGLRTRQATRPKPWPPTRHTSGLTPIRRGSPSSRRTRPIR